MSKLADVVNPDVQSLEAPDRRAEAGPSTMLGDLAARIGPAALQRKIQRRRAAADALAGIEDANAQQAAEVGTSGRGDALPFHDQIQQSFGRHDVSQVEAHTDAPARAGAAAMGAEAFATGDHVAFAGTPTLHTAAHEAAHVVQQRAGVQLKGGVGEAGDVHEQHADAVADRVVRGESAEALLDRHAGGAGPGGAAPVQRKLTLGGEVIFDNDALWDQLEGEGLLDPVKDDLALRVPAYDTLAGWVSALGPKGVGKVRVTSGIDRAYGSRAELAKALVGEVKSREALQRETALAAKLNDPAAGPDHDAIVGHLKTLMPKIHAHVEAGADKVRMWRDMQAAYRGLWTFMGGPWQIPLVGSTVKDAMAQPYDTIAANFNCIKMASNAINARDKPEMFVPQKHPDGYHGETKIEPDSKRHTTMSLKEDWFWTAEARQYDIPLTAGVSGSMNRMYFLAKTVGATEDELMALAWAGHVVFNQRYTWLGNDPHRLHEIMDPLAHYTKVEYDASHYAELVRTALAEGVIRWPVRGRDALVHGGGDDHDRGDGASSSSSSASDAARLRPPSLRSPSSSSPVASSSSGPQTEPIEAAHDNNVALDDTPVHEDAKL